VIRLATPADVPALVGLVHALATYEREPDAVELTDDGLHEALFGDDATAGCHVCDTGKVVGFALWFRTFSTWTGRPGLWLEDLFVLPGARDAGHGRALLTALAEHCVEQGWRRMEWAVLDWNEPAQGFYASLGAGPVDGWSRWRLDGAGLFALGGGPARPTRYAEMWGEWVKRR